MLGLLPVVGSICGVLALFIAGSLLMARGNTGSLVISGDGVSVWSRTACQCGPEGPACSGAFRLSSTG